jgi:hypothetical protein
MSMTRRTNENSAHKTGDWLNVSDRTTSGDISLRGNRTYKYVYHVQTQKFFLIFKFLVNTVYSIWTSITRVTNSVVK